MDFGSTAKEIFLSNEDSWLREGFSINFEEGRKQGRILGALEKKEVGVILMECKG